MITEPQGSPLWGLAATHPRDYIYETNSTREILFADPTVTGYETLIASTPPELQIVVMDPNRDAISQISHILSLQDHPLDALHILSHAQPGILHLGGTLLTAENLPEAEISQWAKALTPDADILLYGCNLAADEGALLHRFAALTGADIAASDNLTGNAALGGDWTLEAHTGPVEGQIPFSAEAIGSYTGVLAHTELFISEYVEGGSNNKALEFYNGTGAPIDLAAGQYSVLFSFNGGGTTKSFNLTGTVAPGDVYVFALNNSTDPAIIAQADQLDTNQFNWFNGDDAIVLFKNSNTTVIDSIGQLGVDPGSAWTGGGVSTQNRTLRRKLSVIAGDTNSSDAFDPSIEWVGYAQDTFAGLGSHNQPPQISISSGNLNYTENDGFALLNTSATATDPDLTNFNGSTLTVNFTNGATTDDILMIRNEGTGAGEISIAASAINYSGLPIGTFTGGTPGNPLLINFNSNSADDAAVAALMQNILYGNISDNPSPGTRTVQFQLTDALGAASIPASKTIDLTAVNDAPIITVPVTLSVDEDMPLVVSGVSITDVDAGNNNITVTLTVNHGNLTVNSGVAGGVAAANISANGTNSVTLTGTVTEINQTLADAAGLTYQNLSDFYGTDNLTIVANDGALTDTQVINITVNSVNDAPVLTLPPSQNANQSVNLPISGINVADVDAASGILEVSLFANHGRLTLSDLTNLTLINGDGIGDAAMTFSGTLADIHNALNNLVYQSNANYSGADTINIVVNDLGNAGAGGSLSAAGNIAITVNPPPDNSGNNPPPDNSGNNPPPDNSGNNPPPDNSGNNPPPDTSNPPPDTSNPPPDTNNPPPDTNNPPPDTNNPPPDTNNPPPDTNNPPPDTNNPPPDTNNPPPDTNNPPPDTNNPPPDTNNPPPDTNNPPPDTNNPPPDTNNPPIDNSGNMPPVVPVVRSGDGSRLVLPPETEPGGELNYCVTIQIPESLNFATMLDSDWVGNVFNGGEAQDVLMGGNGEDALLGGDRDDRIYGGEGSDRIDGGDGNDTMQGGRGRHIPSYQGDRDAIKGGLGNDRIYGNEYNDQLSGDEGNDSIYSGQGEDIAWGGPDRDLIYGDRGSDTLSGDADNDSIYGGPSDPDLADEDGADYISGGTGDDFLNGNQGADKIGGGEGDDTLHGGKGNDWLAGDSGEDMLFGDNGDDILCGGDGDDTLIGGSGSDRFVLSAVGGTPAIADFETGIDKLILASNLTLAELSIQQQDGLTTISSNGKVIAIVFGVSRITAQDFQPIGS
ncbi:DUF4347 domain-containing protein [[Phormidium] sp. ETS-05]|uniref:DUF4347 domain-containing protein n=1 Tax=[Phormidium] sp. ETS-05 TaxID=222819 RepID=UPI0018EF2B7B|nr:DUF4347 domain-containing protein [[Phormidium] sp. ETS-05]